METASAGTKARPSQHVQEAGVWGLESSEAGTQWQAERRGEERKARATSQGFRTAKAAGSLEAPMARFLAEAEGGAMESSAVWLLCQSTLHQLFQ